jgi:hypothetical protein
MRAGSTTDARANVGGGRPSREKVPLRPHPAPATWGGCTGAARRAGRSQHHRRPAMATPTERARTATVARNRRLPTPGTHPHTPSTSRGRWLASMKARRPLRSMPGRRKPQWATQIGFRGPHVPPTAGCGRATSSPEIAKAIPNRPRNTNVSLKPIFGRDVVMFDPPFGRAR